MAVKNSAPQTTKHYLKYALYRYRDSDSSEVAYYFAQLAFLLMCACGDTPAKWRGVFREYDASDCRGSKQQSESVQMTYKQAVAHCKKSVKMIAKDGIDTLLADEHEAFDRADVLEYPLYQQRWMTLRDYPVLYMIYEAADEALAIRTTRLMWQKILLYADMLDAWAEGRKPASYLPIDLHVIDKNDFIQACADIGDGKLTHPTIWSMYAEWKNNKSIDFWFDFVFSMTPYPRVTDTEILDAIDEARSRLTRCYSVDQLADIVMKRSYRARQLLQHEPTMEALREKLSSWQQI